MQKIIAFLLFSISFMASGLAQTVNVQGTVRDKQTGEPLIGATIVYGNGKGSITDVTGTFNIKLSAGEYTLKASYVGYDAAEKKVSVTDKTVFLTFSLQPRMLDEVTVVSDQAITRETPVAFSNVPPVQLEHELAGRDIPMILNSTPGVYATERAEGTVMPGSQSGDSAKEMLL